MLAFHLLNERPLDQRAGTILGVTILLGVGCMFLSPELYRDWPGLAQYLLGNGLLTGTIIAIVMEQVWPKST